MENGEAGEAPAGEAPTVQVTVENPSSEAAEQPAVTVVAVPATSEAPLELAQTVGRIEATLGQMQAELSTVKSMAEMAESSARLALDRQAERETEPEAAVIEEVSTQPVVVEEDPVRPTQKRHWFLELIM